MTDHAAAFFDRLDHLSVVDLGLLALAPVDQPEHDRLLDRIDAAAEASGRMDELDDAADRARDAIVAGLGRATYQPTWFGPNWMPSLGRAEDQARMIGAVEDAAMAAVVADLVPDDAATLAQPFELLASMAGTGPQPRAITGPQDARRLVIWTGGIVLVAIMAFVAVSQLVSDIYEAIPRSNLFG
jgi:hypothetical protein